MGRWLNREMDRQMGRQIGLEEVDGEERKS